MINTLILDIVIETSMDDFSFKVPYLLNVLLDSSHFYDEKKFKDC